ncbi:hypothetical protein B7C51_00945 [Paenibacillus larvae subsp. pulvifaciens]|uniref:PBSX phage terminase small subunit-like N-terminal domain-containing protein n=1 Tax=Paenibacillus larvae subsp. pulvifaciens TaxID=1477 RepID=A0A1V0UNK3_9BACL|nr:phage terminase small subunit [Paenibacillus larvae]ARF66676.1 hypothetical protein B7C51_00945 [Paenibacillus larvae subsp. pulvifaciens]
MARARSPNREKAQKIWIDSGGTKKLKDIAEELGLNESQVRKWKSLDKWDDLKGNVPFTNSNVTNAKTPGAPKGNKNAVGNEGGAPRGNSNAVTHGFFRKYFPEETIEIMEQISERSPLDLLWDQITIQYTAIVRAQRIMFVRDQEDETRVLKKDSSSDTFCEQEYEIQHAWDKQATFLQAQSRAMSTLRSLIKQYEDMIRVGQGDEEQRLRIHKLKGEIALLEQKATKDHDKPIEIMIKRARVKPDD